MTAQEARVLAQSTSDVLVESELRDIYHKIKVTAAKGSFNIITYEALSDRAVEELRGKGYQVDVTYDNRDGNFTTIKW